MLQTETLTCVSSRAQEEVQSLPYPTVKDFLEWVRLRMTVTFRRLNEPKVPSPSSVSPALNPWLQLPLAGCM
jgi:hypothetical protein